MMNKSINLGPLESKLIFTLEEKDIKFFDFRKAKEILQATDSSTRDVLFGLREKNRIKLLEKGKYALNPARSGIEGNWVEDSYLAVDFLLEEYYIGFWSVLEYWGMTEQIPQVLQVATIKRKDKASYVGQEIEFIKISENRFFGYMKQSRVTARGPRANENNTFKIASREKAILDALLYPQHCGGIIEACKAIWNSRREFDWEKLIEFLKRLDVDAVTRRLGYLLDVLELNEDIQKKLKRDFKGFRWLDPSRKQEVIEYSKEWGLQINVSKEELLSWRDT